MMTTLLLWLMAEAYHLLGLPVVLRDTNFAPAGLIRRG
jgi:hypothetical protein